MSHEERGARTFVDGSASVIGACIEVHRVLGPGLLESTYRTCLAHELRTRGHRVEQEVPLPVDYKGTRLQCGYRLDLVVDGSFLVELKAVAQLSAVHAAQVLTYLKLTGIPGALLVNFNVVRLKYGIRRFVGDQSKNQRKIFNHEGHEEHEEQRFRAPLSSTGE